MTLASTYWSVPQAIVWIVLRDIQQADRATELSSRSEVFFFVDRRQRPDWAFAVDGTILEHRGTKSGKEVDLAWEGIINGAAAGKLEIVGIRDGVGDPCQIDPAFFSSAKFCDVPDHSDEWLCLTRSTYRNLETPRFTQVRVKRSGVLDLWPPVEGSTRTSPTSGAGIVKRRRGQRAMVRDHVKSEMRKMDPAYLGGMLEKEMSAKFQASRDTCRIARREVLESADKSSG
jgi:hypothetical protein